MSFIISNVPYRTKSVLPAYSMLATLTRFSSLQPVQNIQYMVYSKYVIER